MNPIEIQIHVRIEWKCFGSLMLNGEHIWRFDNPESARLAAVNLKKALRQAGVEVKSEITDD